MWKKNWENWNGLDMWLERGFIYILLFEIHLIIWLFLNVELLLNIDLVRRREQGSQNILENAGVWLCEFLVILQFYHLRYSCCVSTSSTNSCCLRFLRTHRLRRLLHFWSQLQEYTLICSAYRRTLFTDKRQ